LIVTASSTGRAACRVRADRRSSAAAGHLDRAVQQVEDPGEREQPKQLGTGPQKPESAAGARDEHCEDQIGESVHAEHERTLTQVTSAPAIAGAGDRGPAV
jgi:hypothetical protein